jgi:hypothetical protein
MPRNFWSENRAGAGVRLDGIRPGRDAGSLPAANCIAIFDIMFYRYQLNLSWFPKSDVRFQAANNSQDQRARPAVFSGARRLGSRISAEGEIDG